jgi:hypothetical protein
VGAPGRARARRALRPPGRASLGPCRPPAAPRKVDDRLNGDGAGIALGVNDPVLGAHLLGVFTAIWALYYIANNSDGFLQARCAQTRACCWRGARQHAR